MRNLDYSLFKNLDEGGLQKLRESLEVLEIGLMLRTGQVPKKWIGGWYAHKLVVEAMRNLIDKNQAVDLVNVLEYLNKNDQSEIVGGAVFLADCWDTSGQFLHEVWEYCLGESKSEASQGRQIP